LLLAQGRQYGLESYFVLYASVVIISIFPISAHAPAAATCLSPLASPDLAPTAAFFSPLDLDLELLRGTAAFVLPLDLDLDFAFSLRLLASPDMAPAAAMFLPLDLDLDLRRGMVDGGSGLGGDLGGLISRVARSLAGSCIVDELPEAAAVKRCA
jgi:hypothetical protein